jgi:hypothetical protein
VLFVNILFQIGFAEKNLVIGNKVHPVTQVLVSGELQTRILKNFDRLEETKYQPEHVFLTNKESGNWPGDTEGRTILGLVMDAQSSGREPKYLKKIIDLIPEKLNSKGYMGDIHPAGTMDEQQLSGNGWMIRALCAYYEWKKDKKVLQTVKSIVDNLFVPGKGYYKLYPIDPKMRTKEVGEAMGNIDKKLGNWMLSTDIGCLFIGMDGAINAYKYVPSKALKVVIDEMIERFLEIDLVLIKAQTHATLTAMRGLLTYAEITGNPILINEVAKRWELYKMYGMTENYANYNWFTRYSANTEPCAIVDSYMVAAHLWSLTREVRYLPYLDLIYYNAICHGQRLNGGFGCDKFSASDINSIAIAAYEAHWCCTMRGADGLSKVAECSYFTKADSLYVVHYGDNKATVNFGKKSSISLQQKTQYPFSGEVNIEITQAKNTSAIILKLNALSEWSRSIAVYINGQTVHFVVENGFIVLKHKWKIKDKIKFTFENKIRVMPAQNKMLYTNNQKKIMYGPLLLGYSGKPNLKLNNNVQVTSLSPILFKVDSSDIELSPVYHLMNKEVINSYKKQIMF